MLVLLRLAHGRRGPGSGGGGRGDVGTAAAVTHVGSVALRGVGRGGRDGGGGDAVLVTDRGGVGVGAVGRRRPLLLLLGLDVVDDGEVLGDVEDVLRVEPAVLGGHLGPHRFRWGVGSHEGFGGPHGGRPAAFLSHVHAHLLHAE